MTDLLCTPFRECAPEHLLTDAELGPALRERIAAGREAWPMFDVADGHFVAFLARRSAATVLPALQHAGDLFLACACVARQPNALTAFHSAYEPLVTRVLQRRAAGLNAVDDVKQEVLSKLLVAEAGAESKLADYRGVGPLRSWVATVTVTTLLMARRSQDRRREQSSDDEDPIVDPILRSDPELHYLKEHYRQPVAAAIVNALEQLGDRERVLLRLHLVQRLSIDRLGTMYCVNRATAARWLVNARSRLLEATRRELQRRLGVSVRECDSILKLVHSQLEVSVARYLSSGHRTLGT
jgi:RNA polymerase sigma-70 factor (ECF subfamily)